MQRKVIDGVRSGVIVMFPSKFYTVAKHLTLTGMGHISCGQWLSVALQSTDGREKFLLDLSRGRIDLRKFTMQQRARQVAILARLDLAGAPHRNPDGEEIPTPHLHIYRAGFGAKWAIPLPAAHFSPGADEWQTLAEFMRYCHIIEPPNFQRRLLA